jgi:hypothetical protein
VNCSLLQQLSKSDNGDAIFEVRTIFISHVFDFIYLATSQLEVFWVSIFYNFFFPLGDKAPIWALPTSMELSVSLRFSRS